MATAIRPASDQPAIEAPGRIPELDGFRSIAIWMVLVSHLIAGWTVAPGSFQGIPLPVLWVLGRGWYGVDLFFVLSGLLITGILLDSRDSPHYFRNFYGRRALRILPVYLTVIAFSALYYRNSEPFFILSVLFLANIAHYIGVAVPHGPGGFWSLAVEEHFYLGWPLAVRLLSRRMLVALSLSIVCAEPVLRGIAFWRGADPEMLIYPASWFRFDGLALGALLAVWVRSPRASRSASLRVAGLMLAISLAIVGGGAPFGVVGTKTLAGTALRYTHMQLLFGSAILAGVALTGSRATWLLRTSFMRVSADLSYCVYLIHMIVGDIYFALLDRFGIDLPGVIGARNAFFVQCAAIVGVTFGLAALSKKYLEDPFLRLKKRF
jgi:peptidoglycan/LPS O-acetylase OafA/YrhL